MQAAAREAVGTSSLRRNSVFNIAGRGISLVFWLLITPYLLSKLGAERFGVWSLIFAISGYASVLDLGVGSSVSRFVAKSAAEGRRAPVVAVIRRALTVSVAAGVLWAVAILVFRGPFQTLFHVPAALGAEVDRSLTLFALTFVAASVAQVFQGVLVGFQRLDLSNGFFLAGLGFQSVLLVFGLERGGGLYAAVLATAAGQVFAAVLSAISIRAALAKLAAGGEAGAGSWRDLLGYSSAVQVTNILALGSFHLGKILLGLFGNLALVTQFELGLRVANAAWTLPQLVQGPLVPAAAHALASRGAEAVAEVYLWVCRWAFALGGSAFALLWLTAPAVYGLWLGPGHEVPAAIARTLSLSFAVAMLLGPATAVARGGGWPLLETATLAVVFSVNLATGLWLVRAWGAQGAAIATGVAFAAGSAYALVAVHRRLGVSPRTWWLRIAGPRLVMPAVAAAAAQAATWSWTVAGRGDAVALLALQCGGFTVLLALLSLITGDTQVVWRRIRAFAGARNPVPAP